MNIKRLSRSDPKGEGRSAREKTVRPQGKREQADPKGTREGDVPYGPKKSKKWEVNL